MATLADYPDNWEEIFLSNPNFSMVEYSRKVDEYQRLLKAQQDAAEASGQGEGSDTHANVQWGGGPFSQQEWDSGELDIVADEDLPPGVTQDAKGNRYRVDSLGRTIPMGNRRVGLKIVRDIIPKTVTLIPGYSIIKSIHDAKNKNKKQTTASTSTDTTDTTTSDVIPKLLSKVAPTFQNFLGNTMPQNTGVTYGYNWGTPVATNLLDVVANAGGNVGGLLDAITAIDMNAPVEDNKPF
jgi:hypothetical protein